MPAKTTKVIKSARQEDHFSRLVVGLRPTVTHVGSLGELRHGYERIGEVLVEVDDLRVVFGAAAQLCCSRSPRSARWQLSGFPKVYGRSDSESRGALARSRQK